MVSFPGTRMPLALRRLMVCFMMPVSSCTPQQHVDRSLLAGEQIHQLLNEASATIRAGDIRSLKTLVDGWASWGNQMRKNHRLAEGQSHQSPTVNVQLLASLPNEHTYSITTLLLRGRINHPRRSLRHQSLRHQSRLHLAGDLIACE